jgi:hypothetical protein
VSAFSRLCLAGCSVLVVGCYSLQPTMTPAPQLVGKVVGLDINDAGRAALGGSMGPSIKQVEGRLVQRDSGEFIVAVDALHLFEGGEQVWHGETVHIKSEYVSSLSERRFSPGRSAVLAAAGVGAIAFLASRSLLGLGTGDDPKVSPGDTMHTQRRPRP